MKKLALALATIVALSGCSNDETEAKAPVTPQKVQVEKEAKTAPIATGASYLDFTNTSGKSVDTLWLKLNEKEATGTVSIDRCAEEWSNEGQCESAPQTVLPVVDLAGWQYALAVGAMALGPDETAHLKFTVEKAEAPVTFTVTTKQPKEGK